MSKGARRQTRHKLWRWGNWTARINKLQLELEAAREFHLTGAAAKQCQRTIEQLELEAADVMRQRDIVENAVLELTPLQQKILSARYIDGHSWAYISIKISMAENYLKRQEALAVDALSKKII